MNENDALTEHALRCIRHGSHSFAAASRLFSPATRCSVVLLYAWCRHCDDVIDGQVLGMGRAPAEETTLDDRLADLVARTRAACAGDGGSHPAFEGLAQVVREHRIPASLPLELLEGFAMDARGASYATLSDTLLYGWRVAGVVGVMMARIMGVTDPQVLDRASDLGLAFQLTNIARDVLEDAELGRVYLPGDWLRAEGIHGLDDMRDPRRREALARVVARLLDEAEAYYDSALDGIGALPLRSAWSIASARGIYREIGRKLRRAGAAALETRIGTTVLEKGWLLVRGAAVAVATHALALRPRPPHLFRRPL